MSSLFLQHSDTLQDNVLKKRKYVVLAFLLFTMIIVALDLVSKLYLEEFLLGIPSRNYVLIPQVLHLSLAYNTGAAWSMFSHATTLLGIFSLCVCGGISIYVYHKAPYLSYGQAFIFSCIVAGGLGNAFDRLTRQAVIDFINIELFDFPIFNIADIAVSVGIVLLIVSIIKDLRRN